MSQYNLNDNVKESFDFQLDGHTYTMKYPTTEELENLQVIIKKHGEDSEKIVEFIYAFIAGKDGAPDIKEALRKQNIKVMQNFTNMIKTEFTDEK